MNVIFLTLSRIVDVEERGIYQDLMRKFRDEGHQVYIVSPVERRLGLDTVLQERNRVRILNVKTLNVQKTNVIEKGIGTLLINRQYKSAIKKFLGSIKFDLILYSTPPITLVGLVKYLKAQNPLAVNYLLLKDIFPQNAVDIGMFKESSLINYYFRRKEIDLYRASDYIGCMSPANVEFLKIHNPFFPEDRIEVAPNSLELKDEVVMDDKKVPRDFIHSKYAIPVDKPLFIYGGNLGKPQGIEYIIKCLELNKNRKDCYFIVVGNGTEYQKLAGWYQNNNEGCVTILPGMPKGDYDMLVQACDVGLIFLDHRFTIPNYPSRLLSYMENRMPVICATDVNTDIGKIAEKNGYGYWCESINPNDFTALVDKMLHSDIRQMGQNAYNYLKANYQVKHTFNIIMSHFNV